MHYSALVRFPFEPQMATNCLVAIRALTHIRHATHQPSEGTVRASSEPLRNRQSIPHQLSVEEKKSLGRGCRKSFSCPLMCPMTLTYYSGYSVCLCIFECVCRKFLCMCTHCFVRGVCELYLLGSGFHFKEEYMSV